MRRHGDLAPLRRLAAGVGLLLGLQVFLGLTPWMLTRGELSSVEPFSAIALMRSAHVVCGAMILSLLSVMALWMFRLAVPGEGQAVSTAGDFERAASRRMRDYALLTKARLSALVMVTVAAGYFIAVPGMPNVGTRFATLFGVALVAAGTSALNQYIERDRDALMDRTRDRPVPAGRISSRHALLFGLGTVILGGTLVALWVGALAAVITLATSAIYLCIYTPLKTRTTLNTLVGALPGALPPVIGWVAARGQLELGAFVLFAILYVWQLPHFWSIAWLYRGDYQKGGMKMLSVADENGRFLGVQIALWCLALLITSLLPVLVRMASPRYGIGALVLGLGFLAVGLVHAAHRTRRTTRGVFFASLIYLPALLAALLIDVW
jgi:protoheme IX farnesyltransferase